MALNLRKLRDLISFSREVPDYIPTPQEEYSLPPVEGGPMAGADFSQSMPNRGEGPLRQIGSHREITPTGKNVLSALPGLIESGVAGTAYHGGGGLAADIFGAMRASSAAQGKNRQLALQQRNIDAQTQQRLSQVPQNLARPGQVTANAEETAGHHRATEALGKTNSDIAREKMLEAAKTQEFLTNNRAELADISARGKGLMRVPMATGPANYRTLTKEEMPLQQGANLDLTGAKQGLTEAQTETAGEVPVHYDKNVNDTGQVTVTGLPSRVKPGEAPAPLGTPLVQTGAGKTKPDPMVIATQREELKRKTADLKRAAESAELTPEGSKQMKETQSVARMFDDLLKKLQPYKNDNNPTTFTVPLAKYKLGVKSPEGELGSEISNLSLASIQGMMPFASKSRNYEFIKKIGEHLPRLSLPLPDSPALAYDKLSKARANFARFESAIRRYEVKHATGDQASPKLSPENAAVYVRAAGGDKAKAMQDAINDGWDVTK